MNTAEMTIEQAMEYLMVTDIAELEKDALDTYRLMNKVWEEFLKEYHAIPDDVGGMIGWDSYRNRPIWTDRDYTPDKTAVYNKYWEYAIRCKELKAIDSAGYGGSITSIAKHRINVLAEKMLWYFPFGWGDKHRQKK